MPGLSWCSSPLFGLSFATSANALKSIYLGGGSDLYFSPRASIALLYLSIISSRPQGASAVPFSVVSVVCTDGGQVGELLGRRRPLQPAIPHRRRRKGPAGRVTPHSTASPYRPPTPSGKPTIRPTDGTAGAPSCRCASPNIPKHHTMRQ